MIAFHLPATGEVGLRLALIVQPACSRLHCRAAVARSVFSDSFSQLYLRPRRGPCNHRVQPEILGGAGTLLTLCLASVFMVQDDVHKEKTLFYHIPTVQIMKVSSSRDKEMCMFHLTSQPCRHTVFIKMRVKPWSSGVGAHKGCHLQPLFSRSPAALKWWALVSRELPVGSDCSLLLIAWLSQVNLPTTERKAGRATDAGDCTGKRPLACYLSTFC